MQLKLSTLAIIIGMIFFAYYYSVYNPAIRATVSTAAATYSEQVYPIFDEGIHMQPAEPVQESFDVTNLEDVYPQEQQTIYNLQDNVIQADEPVTLV